MMSKSEFTFAPLFFNNSAKFYCKTIASSMYVSSTLCFSKALLMTWIDAYAVMAFIDKGPIKCLF